MEEFSSWNSYWSFAYHACHEFRFIHSPSIQRFLDRVRETAAQRILTVKSGSPLWRARLVTQWEDVKNEAGDVIGNQECPVPPSEMKPISWKAREGRVNPAGIPCLYLSEHRETALSEVRPWVGASISVAQFDVAVDQKIVNCVSEHPLTKFYLTEPSAVKKEEAVWDHINKGFSRPITHNDFIADYAPTQILTEVFRSAGYNGIRYQSSLGIGANVVLFNLDAVVPRSCCVFCVKKLAYEFEQHSNIHAY